MFWENPVYWTKSTQCLWPADNTKQTYCIDSTETIESNELVRWNDASQLNLKTIFKLPAMLADTQPIKHYDLKEQTSVFAC